MSNIFCCATFLWVRRAKKPLGFSLTPQTCISHQHTCYFLKSFAETHNRFLPWLHNSLQSANVHRGLAEKDIKRSLQTAAEWKSSVKTPSSLWERRFRSFCLSVKNTAVQVEHAKSDLWWKIWDCSKICNFQKQNRLLLFSTLLDV